MSKNWLIRTHQKKILGPVSREKILDFIDKGSLIGEDEICCGNGYWFFVKEKELVSKYLEEQEVQTFNPITEAEVKLDDMIENDQRTKVAQIEDYKNSDDVREEKKDINELKKK